MWAGPTQKKKNKSLWLVACGLWLGPAFLDIQGGGRPFQFFSYAGLLYHRTGCQRSTTQAKITTDPRFIGLKPSGNYLPVHQGLTGITLPMNQTALVPAVFTTIGCPVQASRYSVSDNPTSSNRNACLFCVELRVQDVLNRFVQDHVALRAAWLILRLKSLWHLRSFLFVLHKIC